MEKQFCYEYIVENYCKRGSLQLHTKEDIFIVYYSNRIQYMGLNGSTALQQYLRRSWKLAAVLDEVVALATLSTVFTTEGTAAVVWLCTRFLTPFTTITTCSHAHIN